MVLDVYDEAMAFTWHVRCKGMPCAQGTQTEQKNELLFSKFGISYAKLPERFRKVSSGMC